jgi:hypothetical protein
MVEYRWWNVWIVLATLLGFALLGVNVYRSMTQSFTIDEAFSYNRFIEPALVTAWAHYDANHHVLLALLARASAGLLGPTEFSLRLPVVAGGAVYLLGAIALLLRFLRPGLLFFPTYCALALNPFLLDFLSASRGYGLALGLFVAGLLFMTLGSPRRTGMLVGAGICFGLTISANLVFAVPVAGTLAAFGADRLMAGEPIVLSLLQLCGAAVATAVGILLVPMRAFKANSFIYGSDTLHEMIAGLVRVSFRHHAWFGESAFEQGELALVGVIAVLSLILVVAAFGYRPMPRACRLVLLIFSFTALLVPLIHILTGFKYPFGRTGIYLPPLLALALAAFAQALPSRLLRGACTALLGIATVCFVCEWNTRIYSEWAWDSGTRRNLAFLSRQPIHGPARLGATWKLAETVNFYRVAYGMNWLPPVSRNSIGSDCTYYLLLPEDAHLIAERHLRIMREDGDSGQILAELATAGR